MMNVLLNNIVSSNTKLLPGRYALTWRIALLCAIMAVFAMVYQIPESAISCYLIIYLMKVDSSENIVLAIAITIILALTVSFIFVVTQLTINSPFLRVLAIFCCSYIFVFSGAMLNISPLGNLIALVIVFLLSLLSDVPTGEIATRALLYALLMATSPMFLMIIFNFIIGKKSQTILVEKLLYRISVVQELIKEPSQDKARFDLLLDDSSLDCETHLKLIKLLYLTPRGTWRWLDNANLQTHKLLALATILPKETSSETRHILVEYCQQLSAMITKKQVNQCIIPLKENLVTEGLCQTFNALANPPVEIAKQKSPKKVKEKHHTLPYHYFAIKVTISAVLCYFIYTILDWQGIHTAMITCYVVALGTTAETVHKLLLRISGCLLGALIGVLTIIYIVPHLTTPAGLFVLIFFGMLLPAWITAGSELFSYAGVQIGLAFLLTVLNGFSPSTDLTVAQDRILGILLGNVMCFFVFTYLWPVSLSKSIYNKIAQVLGLSAVNNTQPEHVDLTHFVDVLKKINNIDYDLKLVVFDANLLKLSRNEVKTVYILIRKISLLSILLLLPINLAKKDAYKDELDAFLKNNIIDHNNLANITKLNRLLNKNIISISKDI